jgi:endonuclease YncB( thermonuclease family)
MASLPKLISIFFSLVLTGALQLAHSNDFVLEGRVSRVMDGDTVELITADSTKVRIRLLGIDAPESSQPFGRESEENLKNLSKTNVTKALCIGVDRYKRSLCKLIVNDLDLNLEQIKDGLAWHYKQYTSSQTVDDRKFYAAAEISARESGTGLWKTTIRIPPWDFRKGITQPVAGRLDAEEGSIVKMSKTKICHEPGTGYYVKNTNFSSFASLDDCLNAGGRLPMGR